MPQSLCMEEAPQLPSHHESGGLALKALESQTEAQVGAISLVHSRAPGIWTVLPGLSGSGALCPWPMWDRGWQLDQDLLRVTRRVHHMQVQEAQEGLGLNAGHVKPVGPGPGSGHEGRGKGRGPQSS